MKTKIYKIKSLGKIVSGGTPSTKHKEYFTDKGIPWITPKDVHNINSVFISKGSCDITKLGYDKSGARILPKGTVLISAKGNIGYVAIASNKVTTNQNFESIIPNTKIILPGYLYYLMMFSTRKLNSFSSGSTYNSLSRKLIGDIRVNIPSLMEQQAIVNDLFPLDYKIALNQRINANLMRLIKLVFLKFSNRCNNLVKIKDVSSFINGYSFRSKQLLNHSVKNSKPVFKMKNIKVGGGLNPNVNSWVPLSDYPNSKFIAKKGDILMCMTDMKDNVRLLGYSALMNVNDKYFVNQRVGIIRPTKIPYEYLFVALNSNKYISAIRLLAHSGVQVNLTTKIIKNSKIPLIDDYSMKKFIKIVNPLYGVVFLNYDSINKLKRIRNLLITKLFNS